MKPIAAWVRRRKKALLFAAATLLVISTAALVRPSNDRDWSIDQKILPAITIDGDTVSIQHVRAFSYDGPTAFRPAYVDKTFNINDLNRVWFAVEPLSASWRGVAHTLLSFEFHNGACVAISVEIRKEKGEIFSPLRGLFRRYEIMYVIAEESDVIKLRTNHRGNDVYFYPILASEEQARALFLDMLERARRLESRPEFYNTLTNTCTTNIVRHVRKIAPRSVPRSTKVLLPGYADRLAYDLALIDTSAPFEEVRERHWISGRARTHQAGDDFSRLIRGGSASRPHDILRRTPPHREMLSR